MRGQNHIKFTMLLHTAEMQNIGLKILQIAETFRHESVRIRRDSLQSRQKHCQLAPSHCL